MGLPGFPCTYSKEVWEGSGGEQPADQTLSASYTDFHIEARS